MGVGAGAGEPGRGCGQRTVRTTCGGWVASLGWVGGSLEWCAVGAGGGGGGGAGLEIREWSYGSWSQCAQRWQGAGAWAALEYESASCMWVSSGRAMYGVWTGHRWTSRWFVDKT